MFQRLRAALPVLAAAALLTTQPTGQLTGAAQHPGPSLHEQARRVGGRLVVTHAPDPRNFARSLEALARRSDAVVVGRTLSNRGLLDADGRSVTQTYRVKVQGVIKGAITGGTVITVGLRGGVYRFPDGTHVRVATSGYRLAADDSLYVFFLKAAGDGYAPAADAQAWFGMKGGRIEPAGTSAADPLAAKYRDADAAAFLKELRAAARAAAR